MITTAASAVWARSSPSSVTAPQDGVGRPRARLRVREHEREDRGCEAESPRGVAMNDDRDRRELASAALAAPVEAFDEAGDYRQGEIIPGTNYIVKRKIGWGGHATVY